MSVPYDLLNAYFMETITPEEFAELSAWLQADPDHILVLVKESILHEGLHHRLTGDKLRLAEGVEELDDSWTWPDGSALQIPPLGEATTDEERVKEIERFAQQQLNEFLSKQAQDAPPPLRPQWDRAEVMQALRVQMQAFLRKTVTVAKVAAVLLMTTLIGSIIVLYVQTHRSVAVIAGSTNAEWRNTKEPEAELYRGWHYLESGYVRIIMRKGAEVLLQAPCAFELDSANQLYLEHGSVCVQVPQRAKGFTIETLSSKIVDYGTEFGTVVGGEDHVEIHVFKGKVGVGARTAPKGEPLQDIAAGKAAVLDDNGEFRVLPLAERGQMFTRSLPSVSSLGLPGKSVDLADIVGNGNGFGTGQQGFAIDLNNGHNGPFQTIGRDAFARGYVSLPGREFIDGVFVPDGEQTGRVVISSTGLVFQDCPNTQGECHGYLINGAIFGVKDYQDNRNRVHFGKLLGQEYGTPEFPSIGMHANAGITFDLVALRQSMQNRHIARFTALCGISESVLKNIERYAEDYGRNLTVDFWVLVDGNIQFHRSVGPDLTEPVAVEVELPPSARFLTLMTTDSKGNVSHCWSMFARPVLELTKSTPQKTSDGGV